MQPNENFSFFLDVILLFSLMFFVSRTVYLRSKRKELVKKYKKNRREEVEKMLSTRRLVIASLLLFIVVVKIFLDVRNNLQKYSDSATEDMLFTFTLGFGGFLIVVLTGYYIFKKTNLIIEP